MSHSTVLVPNSTTTDVFYLGVPNDPALHLNLDGMDFPAEDFDEAEFCRTQGSLALFKMGLTNPPSGRRWISLTMRMALSRLTGPAGTIGMSMTLYISGSPVKTFVASTDLFEVKGKQATFTVDLTWLQLNTAELEVDVSGTYLGDVRITGIEISLEDELFSEQGDSGALAGGGAIVTMPVVNLSGIGGALSGGSAVDTMPVVNLSGSGGVLAGGSGDPDFIDIVEVGGGALSGGVADVGRLFFEEGDSGALSGGGAVDTMPVVNLSGIGGALSGGSAVDTMPVVNLSGSGGVLTGGSGDPDFIDIVEVGGGALSGGTADVSKLNINQGTGGAIASGVADVDKAFLKIATGGAIAGGVADVPFNTNSVGGINMSGDAITLFTVIAGGVTFDLPIIQIDEITFLLSWTSIASRPVTFRVYREGLLIATFTSDDGTGSMEFQIGIGEFPFIEVLDTACQKNQLAYPGKITLNFESIAGAEFYRVEEFVNAVWTEVQQIIEDSSGVYLFETRWLEDITTHQFRIIPVDFADNEGSPLVYQMEMTRHPDVPDVSFSYDKPTTTVTISAA